MDAKDSKGKVGSCSSSSLLYVHNGNYASEANTIYEIRYDFDLDGKTIEMQEGVYLEVLWRQLEEWYN